MSAKSQKALRIAAIVILSIVAVVFIVLYFTGRVDDFLGVTGNSSESSSSVAESLPQSAVFVSSSAESKPESTTSAAESSPQSTQSAVSSSESSVAESVPVIRTEYKFRNKNLLNQHYEKHGKDMGFASAEEYEKAAAAVPNNPNVLHKTEKEDGDDVYYVESTNEFVVVSTDGYIRTYFNPDRGIDYYNKQ